MANLCRCGSVLEQHKSIKLCELEQPWQEAACPPHRNRSLGPKWLYYSGVQRCNHTFPHPFPTNCKTTLSWIGSSCHETNRCVDLGSLRCKISLLTKGSRGVLLCELLYKINYFTFPFNGDTKMLQSMSGSGLPARKSLLWTVEVLVFCSETTTEAAAAGGWRVGVRPHLTVESWSVTQLPPVQGPNISTKIEIRALREIYKHTPSKL